MANEKKIAVLGSSGMLGSMLTSFDFGQEVVGYSRTQFDAVSGAPEWLHAFDSVINCVGIIKQRLRGASEAIKVNSLFPHTLPVGSIQIATDCVYSGISGSYIETDPHDALDVYGKTKSLGESVNLINLRCSIIGPEINNYCSLLEWVRSQDGQTVNGFTNHRWNGITTYHFAKLCKVIVDLGMKEPISQHIVPADVVTKAELLNLIIDAYKLSVSVDEVDAPDTVDRTLSTLYPEMNQNLWRLAGYSSPPTIKEMVEELADRFPSLPTSRHR